MLLPLVSASAEQTNTQADPEQEKKNRAKPGLLPAAAALVPGAIVHGAGHFAAGDRKTARRLLLAQGVSVGMIAAGGGTLLLAGANRRLSGPAISSLVMGVGLFATSWFADIYGASGGGRFAGVPELRLPPGEIGVAHMYVADPQFDYGHFIGVQADLRFGPWQAGGTSWFAADDNNQRLRLHGGYRLVGPSPNTANDGSRLDIIGAGTYHRYGDDDFSTTSVELDVRGRFDLVHVSPSLAGAFVDGNAGLGLEVIHYRIPGANTDVFDLLLLGFGFGAYIGDSSRLRGEWSLYYDHRRDDFAAGLSPGSGNGSGFAGHFGARTTLYMSRGIGVTLDAQIGAAFVITTGLRWRIGDPQ